MTRKSKDAHGASDVESQADNAACYAMGYSPGEFQRLQKQGSFLNEFTADILHRAGLSPGMRVLDIGCGVGDVSLVAADLVGPSGAVLGVDRSAESLAIAERRALEAGTYTWTRFETAEIGEFNSTTVFDAVIGRLVLMYQPDPAAVLRRLVQLLRPRGIVAFHEMAIPMARAVPEGPLFRRTVDWITDSIRRAGFEIDMGSKLARTFADAGLATPTMIATSYVHAGADCSVHAWFVETLRSVLPIGERYGVVTAREAELETLAERLATEASDLGACVMPPPLVGAWTRKD